MEEISRGYLTFKLQNSLVIISLKLSKKKKKRFSLLDKVLLKGYQKGPYEEGLDGWLWEGEGHRKPQSSTSSEAKQLIQSQSLAGFSPLVDWSPTN